jgi:hypothetical protein
MKAECSGCRCVRMRAAVFAPSNAVQVLNSRADWPVKPSGIIKPRACAVVRRDIRQDITGNGGAVKSEEASLHSPGALIHSPNQRDATPIQSRDASCFSENPVRADQPIGRWSQKFGGESCRICPVTGSAVPRAVQSPGGIGSFGSRADKSWAAAKSSQAAAANSRIGTAHSSERAAVSWTGAANSSTSAANSSTSAASFSSSAANSASSAADSWTGAAVSGSSAANSSSSAANSWTGAALSCAGAALSWAGAEDSWTGAANSFHGAAISKCSADSRLYHLGRSRAKTDFPSDTARQWDAANEQKRKQKETEECQLNQK